MQPNTHIAILDTQRFSRKIKELVGHHLNKRAITISPRDGIYDLWSHENKSSQIVAIFALVNTEVIISCLIGRCEALSREEI